MTEFENLVITQFKAINDQLVDFREQMNEQFALVNKRFDRLEDRVTRVEARLSHVEEYVETTAKLMPKVVEMLTPLLDDYYERKGLFVK